MEKIIIHVDMDAFYASVETRDNPELRGKPLIIGALPSERGVVSTCSYEARKYGVHSAMSIKEAYRLCPNGIYMHPNGKKYKAASDLVHDIWSDYTDLVQYVSLDEGYLDISGSIKLLGSPQHIGREIKRRVLEDVGITCSVGIGYSMMSAKLASEEKKPNGFFRIPNRAALSRLISGRDVRIIMGVGKKTADALNKIGIYKVRDIYQNRLMIESVMGRQGKQIVMLADGFDDREVTPHTEAKSIGKEHTFQEDITDISYLKDMLRLIAKDLSYTIHKKGIYAATVTLKVTYWNMKQITRAKTGNSTCMAQEIYKTASDLLDTIDQKPIRLIGISLSGLSQTGERQLSLMNMEQFEKEEKIDDVAYMLQNKFGKDAVKTAMELTAEKRIFEKD